MEFIKGGIEMNYEFAWSVLKACVEASLEALYALEDERGEELGYHGDGMKVAFQQVLDLMKEREAHP